MMASIVNREKYILVEYTCDLYIPGIPYRHNWVEIAGKELLIVEDADKEAIIKKLEELGGKKCRDFLIKSVLELTRAEYFKEKAKRKMQGSSINNSIPRI
jgi:hypothetical protein